MSTLTEEQRRRIEENRKKALELRKVSPYKSHQNVRAANVSLQLSKYSPERPVPQVGDTHQRSETDIKANKRRAMAKLHAKKAFAQDTKAVNDMIHPIRTAPTKSNELVNNYVQNVMKPSDKVLDESQRVNRFGSGGSKHKPGQSLPEAKPTTSVSSEQQKASSFFGQTEPRLKATCILVDRFRFKVTSDYCARLVDVFKTMNTRSYDAMSKDWSFKLEEYDAFKSKVSQLQGTVTLSPLPKVVLNVFREQLKGKYLERSIPQANFSRIVDQGMVQSLMPFQEDGVSFGISKNGRLLLADDMGLGKSIQAICVAAYYRNDWPLLVICPSSLRFAWKEHFCRWLKSVQPDEITVSVSGKNNCDTLINIISYDLLTKKSQEILKLHFNVVIVDESHLLKSSKTARTKAALPILKQSRRVILLSGTPALSRPSELYTQIQAVDPNMFSNFQDFGVRYCDGKQMPWGWDFTGSSNLSELQLLLEESIMIRRLKSDVIKQLPSKRREMIVLDPEAIPKCDSEFKNAEKNLSCKLKGTERHGALLTYFQQTSKVKVRAVRNYVLDLLEAGKKFLLFAHHGIMLDALQAAVENKYEYIRIDGQVPAETRKLMCDRFQCRDDVKIALLSITAANTGLNLTAASLVVFAELFWNPGILTQAEDRVHRIGQEDRVIVHYLVATNTADDYIWPLIQAKLNVLSKAGLSKDNFSDANTVIAHSKHHLQTGILDYFKQHSDDVLTENGIVSGEEVKGGLTLAAAVGGRSDKEDNLNWGDDDDNLDWGDDDDDSSMLEAAEAIESQDSEETSSRGAHAVNNDRSYRKHSSVRISNSGLWNLAAQTTDIAKPKLHISEGMSNTEENPDCSFDWLDSIDDELTDVILAGGSEMKRRRLDV